METTSQIQQPVAIGQEKWDTILDTLWHTRMPWITAWK